MTVLSKILVWPLPYKPLGFAVHACHAYECTNTRSHSSSCIIPAYLNANNIPESKWIVN